METYQVKHQDKEKGHQAQRHVIQYVKSPVIHTILILEFVVYGVDADVDDEYAEANLKDESNSYTHQHSYEHNVVKTTNIIANPTTVMIKFVRTPITKLAVL